MYGLPHYGEFDPTFFVAVTYSLLFGIMFGDLGQGMVLVVIGQLLWFMKKLKLGSIAVRIGIFSMFFGILFGSFFGDEEILTPLFTQVLGFSAKPIHVIDPNFTMTLLLTTVGLGAFLILTSIGLNIMINLKRKDVATALFTQNGVAGFIFYASVMGMFASDMLLGTALMNIITLSIFVYLPLFVILMHVPLKNLLHKRPIKPHDGWGAYIVESIFELFEIVLSFVSNTMSFLRVGGFVLSHAGMMVVIMTLREMTGDRKSVV